jgi:hypothetical protein
VDGPIGLAVSAVNAVRKWKYRPYLLNGEPVAVQTEIVVNYALSQFQETLFPGAFSKKVSIRR